MKKISMLVICSTLTLSGCATESAFFNKNQVSVPNNAKKLNVSIQDGNFIIAKNAPTAYQPVNFNIINGNCNTLKVHTMTPNQSASIKICYKGNILFLDEKHLGRLQDSQSTRFYYTPLWQQGFTYRNINTNGTDHFSNATITIKITP